MKKIAIITDAWHPQVNGVVTAYDKVCEELNKRGYEVSIIHPGLFPTVSMPFYPEIRLAIFPRRRLRKMIVDLRPDAVHVPVSGPLGLAARSISIARGIPFTTCYHTHFPLYLQARWLGVFSPAAYAFLRWFHNGGKATMVATESLKQDLGRHGFKNLVLWPLGVDTDLFKRNPAVRSALPKPVFFFLGRVAVEKNIEKFLDADLPGTKLVIGDGPDREKLEARYKDRARFVGYKRGQELVDLLSECDVLVFPSDTETFGLVILEALSCGIPVAAHDVTGPRDIITSGVDGILSDDIADAAKKALLLDREKCRQTAERYSWVRSADAFLKNLSFR